MTGLLTIVASFLLLCAIYGLFLGCCMAAIRLFGVKTNPTSEVLDK